MAQAHGPVCRVHASGQLQASTASPGARQFAENVRADYLAGDIYNKMVRFAENEKRKAGRRHWGSRYDAALSAARTQHEALGGNVGYATLFAFGHSLRG